MVIEFTSLEGQIGRLMYEREHGISPLPEGEGGRRSGEGQDDNAAPHPSRGDTFSPREKGYSESEGRAAIALAIEEHYKPKGPSDAVPTNPVAVAVALADKLDTLVGFWAIDEKPTGSKDPFALRRAALGVVRIILENDVRLQLKYFLIIANMRVVIPDTVKKGQALKVTISEFWARQKVSGLRGFDLDDISSQIDKITKKASAKSLMAPVHGQNNLLEFLADRLKVYLRDKGIRHDLIDAVFALGEDDLVAIVNRVTALQFFLSTEDGENLLAGYKRAANILKAEAKKGDLPEGEPSKPDDSYGAALFEALQPASKDISAALESEDFEKSMSVLAQLRAPIDAFFDNVQIITDDTAVRENNLRLLALIRDTARQIADFEAIQG